MVMSSAGSMLTVYLGVELMSFALDALVALRRDDVKATEAAMKYFVLGALASGVLLYGMSMIYGATGQLDLRLISQVIGSGNAERLPLVFGVVRSEEHTSELQSLMRISYAVFCLKKKKATLTRY